jgi:hypothetical protein
MPMTVAKLFVALSAALGVLFGGAWLGGGFARASAPAGKPSRAVDELAYQNENAEAGEIAVGDALVVNGQPMQLSLFYTNDPPEKVTWFYGDAFRARGLLPIIAGEESMAHVSAFDPQDGMQRFISAIPQPDGQTLVMVGVTNPRHPPKLMRAAESATFPVPKENRAFLGFRSEDAGLRSESGQFVSSLAPQEVADFYRKALSARGWAEKKGESSESMIMFHKGDATLSVALQKLDEKKGAAVFVTRTGSEG